MKRFILGLLLALAMSPGWAQTETVVIEGPFESYSGMNMLSDVGNISRVRAVITYDSSAMTTAGYSGSAQFNDTFETVELYFLDSTGAEIPQTFPTRLTTDANGTLTGSWHSFNGPLPAQSQNQNVLSDTYYETAAMEAFTFWVDVNNADDVTQALFEDASGTLRYVEYFGDGNLNGSLNIIDMQQEGNTNVNFQVDFLYYGGVNEDFDGDGVNNLNDACMFSLTDETVMFDWVDSGVTNYTDESGCTIMDRYAACVAEQEEQPSSPWGWFQPLYSGPSYCEKQVAYGLVNDGIISYAESRMLRSALYQSYSGGGIE